MPMLPKLLTEEQQDAMREWMDRQDIEVVRKDYSVARSAWYTHSSLLQDGPLNQEEVKVQEIMTANWKIHIEIIEAELSARSALAHSFFHRT